VRGVASVLEQSVHMGSDNGNTGATTAFCLCSWFELDEWSEDFEATRATHVDFVAFHRKVRERISIPESMVQKSPMPPRKPFFRYSSGTSTARFRSAHP
jgi:hypothetical protein